MAMNLRLRPDAAAALREEADRTGISQQEILRQIVDEHLGLSGPRREPWPEGVEPPAEPMHEPTTLLHFPATRTSTEVLADLRADRL